MARGDPVAAIASSERNALVGGPFGSNLVSRDYVDDGVPVIRGQNMGGRWVGGDFAYVSPSKAQSLEANLARPGDVIFTQRGTLGQISLVPSGPHDRYVVSQSQMKLTVDRSIADPMFVYYVFNGAAQREHIRQSAIQTGVPHTNLGILRATRVPLPPLGIQHAIAEVLGALDDKIESNRRLIGVAAAEARLRAGGGTQVVRVGDVASLEKGLSYKGAGLTSLGDARAKPMVNLANFSASGWMTRTGLKYYDGDHRPRHVAHPGDVLVANTDLTQQRAILEGPALVPDDMGDVLFTHHVFAVRFGARPELRIALWAQLNGSRFRERAEGFAMGTTVAALPPDALIDFVLEIPTLGDLDEANHLLRRAWLAECETTTLAALRDALLSDLLSGRIRVAP